MTKEVDNAVITMFVQRFKAMPFKTAKHMTSFKKQLVAAMDKIIVAKAEKDRTAKDKKNAAVDARVAVQSEICAKWARATLATDDLIRIRKKPGEYQVIANAADTDQVIVAKIVKQKHKDGTSSLVVSTSYMNVPYAAVYKIKHENKWLDIYSLASGNKGK